MDGMKLRPLGGTGIRVSPIGLGTVKLGRNLGVKYPEPFVIPDDRRATELLSLAAELGINLLDTAPAYGNSEERLGQLLKEQRRQWVICTKAGEEFDPQTGGSSYHFTPEHLRMSVARSLKRLQTDYLDIVLIHSDGNDGEIIEKHGALEVLADLKREGKIRAAGMSTKTVEGGLLAAQNADCVMVTLNLQHREELPVIDYCRQHNKGVLIKKALASGHAAIQPGEDPVRKSFAMIFAQPGVNSAIIGTIDPDHLKENAAKASEILDRL